MVALKRRVKQEPLLSTVARKLGRAAWSLTKVTQQLAENLSTLPRRKKILETAESPAPELSRKRSVRAKPERRGTASKARKVAATATKRKARKVGSARAKKNKGNSST